MIAAGLNRRRAALLAALGALASCSHRAPPPAAVAEAPAPAPPRPAMPALLAGIDAPPHAADGGYDTINHGIGPEQTAWHVRAALNVAAVSCRGANGSAITDAYNHMLKADAAPLGKANDAVKGLYRARYGADWQAAHDAYMTRLYNYFALPSAKAGFCAAAAEVAPQAAAVAPGDFVTFAQGALPRLDAPILALYREVDAYRLAAADWDRRYGPDAPARTELAAAAPARKPAPRLAYADMGSLLMWQPNEALAMR